MPSSKLPIKQPAPHQYKPKTFKKLGILVLAEPWPQRLVNQPIQLDPSVFTSRLSISVTQCKR
jgi:hypothetical protein